MEPSTGSTDNTRGIRKTVVAVAVVHGLYRPRTVRTPSVGAPSLTFKAVHPREVDWTLWPWWRELQPGKPQRVEQPPPIAQVAEDPADRRGGELDQGGRDQDVVVQAALRLPQDVDDLELPAIG